MALNVLYSQYSKGVEAQSLKATAKGIVDRAIAKSSVGLEAKLGLDLYNGEIDAITARQVAMSGSSMQITLNNNLSTALNFLKTKAATENTVATKSDNTVNISDMKDKEGSNPFYNGEFAKSKKSTKNENEYLFINVA